ncbi:MAG: hypothetical protein P8L32_08650 [Paracoccaceae bacterium]|nr:hypothetical protein [Paracoccaceae bacterium]
MRFKIVVAIGLCMPGQAFADCPSGSELLISCTFRDGAKTVTTCLSDDQASYAYGPTGGAAELSLIRSVRDVDMQPWNGWGRWISEGFTFQNGAYSYTVRYAIDKLAEDTMIEGDLWVSKGESTLVELICDAGSVNTSGYPLPLFDAKTALGQNWNMDEFEWSDAE